MLVPLLLASHLAALAVAARADDGLDRSTTAIGEAAGEAEPKRPVADLQARLAAARGDLEREQAARADAELALMARERDLLLERQRSALLDRQAEILRAENEALRSASARDAALLAIREEVEWTERLLAGIPRFTTFPTDLQQPLPVPGAKPAAPAGQTARKTRVAVLPSPLPRPPRANRPPLAAPPSFVVPAPDRRPPAVRRLAETAQRLRRRGFTLPEALRPLGP